MPRPILALVAFAAFACTSCGGSTPAASGAPPAASSQEPGASPSEAPHDASAGGASPAKPAAREPKDLLTTCAVTKDDLCLPDAAFVARLCDGAYPDAALAMMNGKSQFSRVWVRGETEGWNADVGKSARAHLRASEEVLVLKRRHAPKNGIVVGAGGGYLVMRWDGNCYTLDDGEVLTTKPASPRHAPLAWQLLEPPTKDALLSSPRVLEAFKKRGKECKGVTSGEVSKACELADAALTEAVVREVRAGLTLPVPQKLP